MFDFGDTKIILKQAELQRLLNSPSGPVAKELLRVGAKIEAESKRLLSNVMVNVDTGRLRSSTTHVLTTTANSMAVIIGSGADYGIHVLRKNRPYLQTAGNKVLGAGTFRT